MKDLFHMRQRIIGCAMLASLLLIPGLSPAQTGAQPGKQEAIGRYTFSDLAERVIPSVVTVYVKRDLKNTLTPEERRQMEQWKKFFNDPQLRQFFSPFGTPGPDGGGGGGGEDGDPFIAKGSGSGVVISSDGYILTNWHVVGDKKDKSEIRVVLSDDTELSGKDVQLIESSQLIDLALLKINRTGLKPLPWGDSDGLRIGERVAAIGSPLDLRLTVTQGIICAKHREVGLGLGDMLQTDAVINPGSSGGALINLDGQLIGINRMITTPFQSGRWEGYGFAIPAKDAKYFVDEVQKKGHVTYGYIGVMMGSAMQDTPKMRRALGLDKDKKGVLVMGVSPGTPAYEAGMQEGDLITAADGHKIEDSGDLLGYVARRPIGTVVNMTVLRNSGDKTVERALKVKIAERPTEESLDPTRRGGGGSPEEQQAPKQEQQNDLGLSVEPYSERGQQGLRVTGVDPDSAAARAGLKEGDVLLKLNRQPLRSPEDLKKAISQQAKGRPHLLQFTRQGRTQLTTIDQGPVNEQNDQNDSNDSND